MSVRVLCVAIVATLLLSACHNAPSTSEAGEIHIPKGAGGVGFLPLLVMEKNQLIEKYAKESGVDTHVRWIDIGGPSIVNDALLSGSADFIAAGPPAFIVLWDRTADSAKVMIREAKESAIGRLDSPEAERVRPMSDFDKKP